jgi:uncharacterized protein YcgI (DUF1989 family)
MSTIQSPMMTIVKESMEQKGIHDVHQRMCNSKRHEFYGVESRDGCLEIIAKAIAPYALFPEEIPDTIAYLKICTMIARRTTGCLKNPLHVPVTTLRCEPRWMCSSECRIALKTC